jgi:hypothetical protein
MMATGSEYGYIKSSTISPLFSTCTRDATAASAAAAGQRQRKRRSQMLSASQAVRQEREQPPSAHTSASCARFEPAESTGELFRTSERGGERLRPGGERRRRRRCPREGRPISPRGPAPARAPFRAIPLSAAATVSVPATNRDPPFPSRDTNTTLLVRKFGSYH